MHYAVQTKSQTYCILISALASAPSRPPNPTLTPQNQALKKKLVQKSQKLKKQGVLTVNIIPISHKSAKIAIFSCQKSRVPNKIETWINQNSVVTGIWTDPKKGQVHSSFIFGAIVSRKTLL